MALDDFIAARKAHMVATEPAWSSAQFDAMVRAAEATRGHRRRRRVVGGVAVALAAVGLLAIAPRLRTEPQIAAPSIAGLGEAASPRNVEISSAVEAKPGLRLEAVVARVEPLSEDAKVRTHAADQAVRWTLDRGKVRFIAKAGVVDAGHAEVRFAGAVVVERTRAGYAVAAERSGVTVVRRGTEQRVAKGTVMKWTDGRQSKGRVPAVAEPSPKMPSDVTVGAWRSLALAGEAASACDALEDSQMPSDVEALMLAADTCRKARRPKAAVPFLQRVVDKHESSAMAPLAAFTLGRLYREKLRAPSSAARLFSTARSLDPDGPLADNAWAKEAEAWAAAGRSAKAQARAAAYLHALPSGRHRDVMQTLVE